MRYIVDRIEEEFAVCENEDTNEMEEIDVWCVVVAGSGSWWAEEFWHGG